jgi:cell division protein FtsW
LRPHTDSIFAVIGEVKVVGTGVVVLLYVAFIFRGFRCAAGIGGIRVITGSQDHDLGGGQTMLNIAVMTALVPPTGLPLPFISLAGRRWWC